MSEHHKFASEEWELNHICSKAHVLPPEFFDFSIFGKSIVGPVYSEESEMPSALKINNFVKAGFPLSFCTVLKCGLPLLLRAIPPRRGIRNHTSARQEENREFVEATLQKWEETGVIKYVSYEPHIVNPFNVVVNGVKKRLVLDAKASGLNDHIIAPKFKLPDMETIIDTLYDNDYMTKMDLASGFLQLSINKHEQTYLGFKSPVDGRFGVVQRLPFGLRSAPFLFASFTYGIQMAAAKVLNVETQVYIDDWLLANRSLPLLTKDSTLFTEFLDFLGVAIQHEKTEGPGQAITYLGLIVDTRNHKIILPEVKRIKYLQGIQEILVEGKKSMASVVRTAGRLVHIATVHKAGASNIQPLWEMIYMDKKTWTKAQLERVEITLDNDIIQCLLWWRQVLSYPNIQRNIWKETNGRLFLWTVNKANRQPDLAQTMSSDASDSGWGAVTGVTTIAGKWSKKQEVASINWRELKAVILAIESWRFIEATPLLVLTDSTTVVAAIRKRASQATALQLLIKDLAKIERRRKIEIVAIHIPGSLNDLPDRLSRGLTTEVSSILEFKQESFPNELRSNTKLVGMKWENNRFDACPFFRNKEVVLEEKPLLIAATTPDLPFLKLHLKKFQKHPYPIFILIPKQPSSELPLPFTIEIEGENQIECNSAANTKWTMLEVIRIGGIAARNAIEF